MVRHHRAPPTLLPAASKVRKTLATFRNHLVIHIGCRWRENRCTQSSFPVEYIRQTGKQAKLHLINQMTLWKLGTPHSSPKMNECNRHRHRLVADGVNLYRNDDGILYILYIYMQDIYGVRKYPSMGIIYFWRHGMGWSGDTINAIPWRL